MLSWLLWQLYFQGLEQVELLRVGTGYSMVCGRADMDGALLDPAEGFQQFGRRGRAFRSLQAHPQDAVKDEGEEADERMRADAVWQSVVDRGNFNLGFENAEPPLDISKRSIACNDLFRRHVRQACHQQKLAI